MYDGSITIDTRVDSKGINKGTKSITSSIGGILRALKFVGAAIGLAFSGAAIFSFMKSFDLSTSSIGASISKLSGAFDGLKGAFANLIIAALAPIIPYIVMVVQWLTTLFTTLAQIVGALFGVSASMGGVASGAGAVAGGMKDTAKETKKAVGALAAFDELSVLSKPDAGVDAPTSGGGGGGAGGGTALPKLPPINPELLASIEAFKVKFMEFIDPVVKALERLQVSLAPLGQTIWSGLKWAWDFILVPLGTWTITDLLPKFLDLLGAAGKVLNAVLIALQPMWQWFWDKVLKPLLDWTGSKIIETLDLMTAGLTTLGDWISAHPDLFQLLVISAGAFALAIFWVHTELGAVGVEFGIAGIAQVIWISITSAATAATWSLGWAIVFLTSPLFLTILAIAGIILVTYLLIRYWDQLSVTVSQLAFIIAYYFTMVWEKMKKWFSDMWEGVKQFATDTVQSIKDIWNGIPEWFRVTITDPIAAKFSAMWENTKMFASGAWEYVKTAWRNALAWFQLNVTLPLQQIFQRVWETIKSYASNAWTYITGLFAGMGAWVKTNITDPIATAFSDAMASIKRTWTNVFNWISDFTSGIFDGISGMVSGIIDDINYALDLLSNLTSGDNKKAPVAKPIFSDGSVAPINSRVTTTSLAQNGLSAETIQQIIEGVASSQTITIKFSGTLSGLVQELKPYIDAENSRMGQSLITSGAV